MRSQLRDVKEKPNAEPARELGGGSGTRDEPKKPQEGLEEPPSDRQHVMPKSLGEPSGWDAEDETSEPHSPDDDLQARLDKLHDAANSASAHVRNVYVTFLLFGLYLAIIFGSTTHEQLLRSSPVTLPLLDVGLPLVGFYWVAPALFVLLHLNLLLQFYLLSGKLHRLDQTLRRVGDGERAEERRAQLYSFPFSHALIGRHHGRLMRLLLWLVVWLTVIALPVVLLLGGQVRFLPYHGAWTTMWHRVLVVADLLMILVFWRLILHPTDRLLKHPGRWLLHQSKMLPGSLAALTLSLVIFTFPGDFDTLVLGGASVAGEEEKIDFGDPIEEWVLAVAPESLIDRSGTQPMLWPTRYAFELVPFLERNLVVREINLVGSWPTQTQIDQYGEDLAWQNFGAPPNLRERDLRYADLSYSILVRGDLRDANLQEANLWGTNLQGADLLGANLQGARLNGADLQGAEVFGVDLQGAELGEAHLQGAFLVNANLKSAVLLFANLHGADLTGANLQAARLIGANLQGADLTIANLQGAVFWKAGLQGADLGDLRFQGGISLDTSFQGEDLLTTIQQVLGGADLRGADLRGAHLWRVRLDKQADLSDRWGLADLRGIDVTPIADLDAWIEEVLQHIAGEGTRDRVAERLRAALRDDDRPEAPGFPDGSRSAPQAMFDRGDPIPLQLDWGAPSWATIDAYDQELEAFLGELACGAHATGDVAKGLAERVRSDSQRLYAKQLASRSDWRQLLARRGVAGRRARAARRTGRS